jgi:LPS export ABC transporter protein LptC
MQILLKRHLNTLIFVTALAVVSLPAYILMTRGGGIGRDVAVNPSRIDSDAEIAIEQFHFTEREKGERKWEIWAERAERFLGEARVHMEQVRVEYLPKAGGRVHLAGRVGDYYEDERRVVLSGDVEVKTDSGYTLYAARLTWEEPEQRVVSEEPVRLVNAGYVLWGDRMVFRTDLQTLEVTGSVRTVITPVRTSTGNKG